MFYRIASCEYNDLINKYDSLFDYFKEIEDNVDEISFANHEYKNQLAVIKGYIENNKNTIISTFKV